MLHVSFCVEGSGWGRHSDGEMSLQHFVTHISSKEIMWMEMLERQLEEHAADLYHDALVEKLQALVRTRWTSVELQTLSFAQQGVCHLPPQNTSSVEGRVVILTVRGHRNNGAESLLFSIPTTFAQGGESLFSFARQ